MDTIVSVILPCYNHEKFIKKCILSILSQTFTNFELLIADDCSKDHSWKIIQEIEDERIKRFRFESNVGTVRSLNYLLSKCKGSYIAVIGSDDYWQPDKLYKQVSYMEKHRECAACFCWAKIIDENDLPYESDASINADIFHVENRRQGEWLKLFYDTGNHLCHSSALIRKSVHDSVGEYNPAYRQLHDFDLWIRILNRHPIHVICENLVGYRRTKTNSQCVSEASKENTIRLIHESNNIIYNLFCVIRKEILKEGFLNETDQMDTDEEVVFQKYCILKKYSLCGVTNLGLANTFLMNQINGKIVDRMTEYGVSLNQFYRETGKIYHSYPVSFVDYYVDLQNNIDQLNKTIEQKDIIIQNVLQSRSWKITAPLRLILSKLKMMKSGMGKNEI